jgi:hypothetical protein
LIDALCLDQSSTEGKSNQIPLVGKIYSQAEKVFIWIDEEEEDSGAEMALIQTYSASPRKRDRPPGRQYLRHI